MQWLILLAARLITGGKQRTSMHKNQGKWRERARERLRGKGKYRNRDNKTRGIKRENFYRKKKNKRSPDGRHKKEHMGT